MGSQVVYCAKCQVRLTRVDFEKGGARKIKEVFVCGPCYAKLPRKPAPAQKSGATARRNTTRSISVQVPEAASDNTPAGKPWLIPVALGSTALVLVVIIIILLTGRGEVEVVSTPEIVKTPPVVEPVPEPQPEPVPEPVPEPEPEPKPEPEPEPVPEPKPDPKPEPEPKPDPKPEPEPKEPEPPKYADHWKDALALAVKRDIAGARKVIERALTKIKGVEEQGEAAGDVELLRKVAVAERDATLLLSGWPRKKMLAVEYVDMKGKKQQVEGPVKETGSWWVDITEKKKVVRVDLAEVSIASRAKVLAEKDSYEKPFHSLQKIGRKDIPK